MEIAITFVVGFAAAIGLALALLALTCRNTGAVQPDLLAPPPDQSDDARVGWRDEGWYASDATAARTDIPARALAPIGADNRSPTRSSRRQISAPSRQWP
jgi:hypothetical protein